MGVTNDKSSELERGSSLRASVRFSNVQGEDDDYDVQALVIADGFRPVEAPHTQPHTYNPRSSITPQDAPTAQIPPPPRPSSITKPHRRNESLSLQHDGSSTESDGGTTPTRDSTVSTTSPFVDSEEPYDGPSGPSHPYQMYPQNVRVARTASLATTSTAPISERSYNGPRGPAHPYGMYPQNTIPEAGGISRPTAQGDINLGFPGTADNYQRRLGPDGEDVADLIGPDGHTEQLPPYTRYPEEAYTRKAMGVEIPQPAPVPVQPMLAIPGAGGIGMATRNPEFASTEDLGDLNSPQSRQSVRSFTSDSSQRVLNVTSQSDSEVTDEKNSLKEWQVTAKRRVWGIVPCWAILLASIVLVLVGIILGAVVGTLVNNHPLKKGPPPDGLPSPAVTSSNWDTQPLATLPPELQPLPEGNFSLQLGLQNNRMSNTCFSDSTQAQSWSCTIFPQLKMTIGKVAGQPNTSDYSFKLSFDDPTSGNRFYFWQPPDLPELKLKLVNDLYETGRGPAWNFEVAYNKTVMIHDSQLSVSAGSTTHSRRRMFDVGSDFGKRRGVASPGDKVWICYWNNTILETFIYAGQNNSFSHPPPPPMTSSSTSLSGDIVSGVPGAAPTPGTSGVPAGIENSGDIRPSQGPSGDPQDYHLSTPSTDGIPTTTSASSSASSSGPSGPDFFPFDPPYPRVIKVEERRNAYSTTVKPMCRQYLIRNDFEDAELILDDKGNPIEIYIDEDEGQLTESGGSKRNIMENNLETRNGAKGAEMSECGCMWWLI